MSPTAKTEMETQVTNSLAGHVYFFAPDIDSTQCTAIAECDCCAEDLLFLNGNDFVKIAYCMAEKNVMKGTYILGNNNLILKYDSLSYYTEADENDQIKTIDKNNTSYLINTLVNKSYIDTLTLQHCKGKTYYHYKIQETFGTISQKDSIQTYIDELKKEGFWNKLNIAKKEL